MNLCSYWHILCFHKADAGVKTCSAPPLSQTLFSVDEHWGDNLRLVGFPSYFLAKDTVRESPFMAIQYDKYGTQLCLSAWLCAAYTA